MAKASVVDEQPVKVSPFVSLTYRDIINSAVAGLVVGLVYMIALYLLNTYVFSSVLCRPQSANECSQAPAYAAAVAAVISALLGLGALVRLRIYRPLLVVIASVISLWGIGTLLLGVKWYAAALIAALLFALCYAAYT